MQFHSIDKGAALAKILAATGDSAQLRESWARTDVLLSDCGTYQVCRRREPVTAFKAAMVVLGIERVDQQPFQNWAILQHIKNALVGPECEGMQIFPAESRLVDRGHVYWLYCFSDPAVRIPCGVQERHVSRDG